MNRTATATAIVAVLLLLAGCSTGGQENTALNGAPTVAPTDSASVAPLVAEAPSESAPPEASTPDSAYLAAIKEARAGAVLSRKTQIPDATDAQLLEAGREACARVAAGEVPETVSVISGETPDAAGYFTDSSAILGAAQKTLCP